MDVAVPSIDVHELAEVLDSGALLIDVREPHEFEAAHAPTARLVPLQTVPDALDALPADEPVYVICHSGGRSLRAAEFLRAQGVDAVNVAGGTSAWIVAELPVETGLPPE